MATEQSKTLGELLDDPPEFVLWVDHALFSVCVLMAVANAPFDQNCPPLGLHRLRAAPCDQLLHALALGMSAHQHVGT